MPQYRKACVPKSSRLICALNCEKVDQTPIWIMRQAGRYLPEYREVRKKAKDFLNLCKTPELACQVTLQPIQRFPLDAAIIFSDILVIPDALGLGLQFVEGEGPKFQNPIRTKQDIEALPTIDPEIELRYVMDAIRLVKSELLSKNIPLIGFAGSPWTVATYMIEGKTSKDFSLIKRMLYREPEMLHHLLKHLANCTTDYLNAQVAAGAEVLMLFDSWGGILARSEYLEFSLAYLKKIVQDILQNNKQKSIPIILFTKNSGQNLAEIALSGCRAIGLDWTADLKTARQIVGPSIALQGNLDPAVLYAKPKYIEQAVKQVLEAFGPGSGHIFNLGHGIYPDVVPEQVQVLIEAVQTFSRPYHRT